MTAHRKDTTAPSDPDGPQHQSNKCLPAAAACPLDSVSAVQAVVCTLPALLPLFIHSVIHTFTPTDVFWLCVAALAALLQFAPAAPVNGAFTDNPAGDTSGEEWETERPADPLIALLKVVLEVIKSHRQEVSTSSVRDFTGVSFSEHHT